MFFLQDDRVPRFYIEELRRHIVLYPTEDQVRLTTVIETRCLIRPTRLSFASRYSQQKAVSIFSPFTPHT